MRWSSVSSLQVTLMRAAFLPSLMTAMQRQLSWPSIACISFSIACLTDPGCTSLLSFSSTLDVSTVQYSVSVIVDGVVFNDERDCRLLGRLLGGVRATSA